MLAGIGLVGIALALLSHGHHVQGLPGLIRGSIASLVLFLICGDALAYTLVPGSWGVFVPLFSLPFGALASGLVLMVFGVVHVPLAVSLWLTLALGLVASFLVRRGKAVQQARVSGSRTARWLGRLYPGVRMQPRQLGMWMAVLFVLFCVALIPIWRNGIDTVPGENPDAQQVVGIAVLFQHVPPTATDYATAINTVPPAWRFRYPIFYPLAAASNLSHFDPIRVFPGMEALLMIACALGFAALAVKCLGSPEISAPAVATTVGISWVVLHLGWHPYWNQLWGMTLFPYALLFGWRALADRDWRAAAACLLLLVGIELAYPLALPYPLLILLSLWLGAYWRRPKLPRAVKRHAWIAGLVAVIVLLPAVTAAALKLDTAVSQILSAHSTLWGGDITALTPLGRFVGVGGGLLPALAVLLVAAAGLWALPRRVGLALGFALLVTFVVDVRFRTAATGAYMDFKHLSFVGSVVLVLAISAVTRMVSSRSRRALIAGALIAGVWTVAALELEGRQGRTTGHQVTAELFQIRRWANELPRGASVRVDIPASGWQLWAVYMLGNHPVDATDPVVSTTYAHAPYGTRAEYSLALRYASSSSKLKRPAPLPLYTENPPVFENDVFVLRRVAWPVRLAAVRSAASRKLVEP
jgi:hypothetical protein